MRVTHARVGGKEAAKVRDKERIFCEEFLVDLNAYAAAVRAGYSHAYAKDASKWIHPEHPEKPKMRAEVDRLMALRSRRVGISADRVMVELAKVAFVNPGDLIDTDTGAILPDAAPEDLAALAGIRVKDGKYPERDVHLCDKLRALELLGKHLGMFDDKARREQGEQSSVNRVAEIMARLDAESGADEEGDARGSAPLDPRQRADGPLDSRSASGGATGDDGAATGGDGGC